MKVIKYEIDMLNVKDADAFLIHFFDDEILSLVKKNIGWDNLVKNIPQNHSIAENVCTNLIGLSEKKINTLIEHSEWMTEVQVRLHLPFLI